MVTICKDFKPQGGKHCITNSLKQVFTYYGYPISEEMLFGIASGLSFLYLNQLKSPMVSGRTKVFEFEKKLAQRLHINITCKSGKKYASIENHTKQLLDKNQPVLIYVDMPYLKYLGMDEQSHFGGHAVVVFGYDDKQKTYYISDRDNHDYPIRVPYGQTAQNFHLVSYEELQKARSSSHRPFPANNKYLVFDFQNYQGIHKDILLEAIKETSDTMLYPPAQLLGIHGIKKFSKEIRKWKQFTPDKLRVSGITNYFQISEDGGTGGGIFRKMYGEFLLEAALILKHEDVIRIGKQFLDVAKDWDDVANMMWQLSLHGDVKLLELMSENILQLYEKEKTLHEQLEYVYQEMIY